MDAQQPAGHVPEESEAKHQQANSDVRGIRPSLPENWRHADLSVLILGEAHKPQNRRQFRIY